MEDFYRLLFFLGDRRSERRQPTIVSSVPEKFHAVSINLVCPGLSLIKSIILVDLIGRVLFDLMRLQFLSARYAAPRTITRFMRPEYIEET
jgi:hypothetical protein